MTKARDEHWPLSLDCSVVLDDCLIFTVSSEGCFCWMGIASECYNVICCKDSLRLKFPNVAKASI